MSAEDTIRILLGRGRKDGAALDPVVLEARMRPADLETAPTLDLEFHARRHWEWQTDHWWRGGFSIPNRWARSGRAL